MTQTPAPKAPPVIEILHLDEMGYGPNGSMTRRDWRETCLTNLLAGKEQFKAWQNWILTENTGINDKYASFGLRVNDEENDNHWFYRLNSCTLDFSGHSFLNALYADQFEFILPCNFRSTMFKSGASFSDATFLGDEKFIGVADFSKAKFERVSAYKESGNFRNAKFIGVARFNDTMFESNAVFSSAKFNGLADFNRVTVLGNANFDNVVFTAGAQFSGAVFTRYTSFSNAKFIGYAVFSSATFEGGFLLSYAAFTENADFSSATFTGYADFRSANFEKQSNFENAKFTKIGHFEKTNFKTEPPSFRGVDIATTRLEFAEAVFPENSNTQQAVDDISFLKRLSDEHGQTDQALNFNAMELRAKRLLPDADWGFKATTWLYEVLSDFGRSFTKPIFWYGALICFGAILAMGYSTYIANPTKDEQKLCLPMEGQPLPLKLSYDRAVFEYAMFRAGGVMDLTDTGKQNNAVNCRLFGEPIEPPVMRGWGVVKGIASIALLFLAALGLRNKYRIK